MYVLIDQPAPEIISEYSLSIFCDMVYLPSREAIGLCDCQLIYVFYSFLIWVTFFRHPLYPGLPTTHRRVQRTPHACPPGVARAPLLG